WRNFSRHPDGQEANNSGGSNAESRERDASQTLLSADSRTDVGGVDTGTKATSFSATPAVVQKRTFADVAKRGVSLHCVSGSVGTGDARIRQGSGRDLQTSGVRPSTTPNVCRRSAGTGSRDTKGPGRPYRQGNTSSMEPDAAVSSAARRHGRVEDCLPVGR